jgi:hypothetical protein
VFAALLKQFNPGALPHLFILTTMANLAEVNGKLTDKYNDKSAVKGSNLVILEILKVPKNSCL